MTTGPKTVGLGRAAKKKPAAKPEPVREPDKRAKNGLRRTEGSVSKTPAGRFRVRVFLPDGSRITLPGGPWTTEEAADKARERYLRTADENGLSADAKAATPLSTIYEDLLTTLRQTNANTVADRARFANRVIYGTASVTHRDDILGHWPVGSITRRVVANWAHGMLDRGQAIRTVHKWVKMVGQTLDHAAEEEYILKSPIGTSAARKKLQLPPIPKTQHFLFTLEELVTMTWSANPDDALFWETLMWTGMRSEESRQLTPLSLVRRGELQIEKAKTEAGQRHLYVPTPIWDALEARAVGRKIYEPLFPGEFGGTPTESWFSQQHARTRRRAGLLGAPSDPMPGRRTHPTAHDHRATIASYMHSGGIPVGVAQSQLGHASSAMTLDIYTSTSRWLSADPALTQARREAMEISAFLDHLYAAAWSRADTIADPFSLPLLIPFNRGGRPAQDRARHARAAKRTKTQGLNPK